MSDRDAWGGFTALRLRPAGFFRLAQARGRWWFFTPEGHAFIAVGFNHATSKFLNQSHNRDRWAAERADPARFEEMVVADARDLNMTMIGYGEVRPRGRFPYVERVTLPGPSCWMDICEFPDMFDDAFARACDEAARRVCVPRVDDPALIGWMLNDVPEWPIEGRCHKRRAVNWTDALKALGPEAPGKRAYVEMMRQRHSTIASVNTTYRTTFASFDDLARDREFVHRAPLDPARVRADDAAFTARMIERYYEIAFAAVRRADPNHLVLGEIHEGNRGVPPAALAAMKSRADALTLQYYGEFRHQIEDLERWHRETGLPVFLADSCFSTLDLPHLPRTCGPRVGSHAERAEAFARYARQALRMPWIVGWVWCGYMDGSVEFEPRRQHQGLKDAWGNPHEPLWSTVRDTWANLYALARADVPSA